MDYISRYLNMELLVGDKIVNVYSIPVSTFTISNQNELTLILTEIFDCMINDLLYGKNTSNNQTWEKVNFYVIDNEYKSLEIVKTKTEIDGYPSYGECIFTIYHTINQ